MNRRTFLASAAVAASTTRSLWGARTDLKIGVTDWNLRQTGKLEAVALAKSLDFDGVQVSIGRQASGGKMPMDDPALIQRYIADAKERKIPLDGTCLDILHVNYLKNDKLGEKWVSDGIRITKALGTKVMLLPFFGNGQIKAREEQEYVADVLKNLGPEAEKAKVILGLENTISAVENLRIMERAKSPAVLVYYDIGNSHRQGYDVTREIRDLGAKRICQFHFKDNPGYLGEGKIDMAAVMKAVGEIGYKGYANLETDSPSKNVEADMRRNLTYVRRVMSESKL